MIFPAAVLLHFCFRPAYPQSHCSVGLRTNQARVQRIAAGHSSLAGLARDDHNGPWSYFEDRDDEKGSPANGLCTNCMAT